MKVGIDGIKKKIDANGKVMTKKSSSHGTWRAKRKPNSKRVKNGTVRPHQED